jgi:hypothetical protein
MKVDDAQRASGGSARGPSRPSYRPTWLLVLSSITLVYGGLSLVSGLTALRDPSSAARLPMAQPLPPAEEALTNQLIAVNTQVVAWHARGIRGRAAASVALALLMLYSAAAAFSRDRHGRTAMLMAGWLGIIFQVGSLPVVIPIARDYATASAPLLAQLVAAQAPPAAPSAAPDAAAAAPPEALKPEAVATFMHSVFIGIPIVTALLGIAGSLLLIGYFGGRKGRALYGLGPAIKPK